MSGLRQIAQITMLRFEMDAEEWNRCAWTTVEFEVRELKRPKVIVFSTK